MVVEALRRSGRRGILATGWGGMRGVESCEDILVVGSVSHEWLFPRMAAVVHHAGAGTTAAGLRAGVPTVPVPVMVDQPFWAQHLVRLGVAPTTLPFRRLTTARLGAAIHEAVAEPAYRQQAAKVAAILSQEDGTAGVLKTLNNLA